MVWLKVYDEILCREVILVQPEKPCYIISSWATSREKSAAEKELKQMQLDTQREEARNTRYFGKQITYNDNLTII